MWPRFVAGIFIPVGNHYFQALASRLHVCGSSVRQAVARPRHRQSVCIHNIHVAATCRPSVLGSATMRGHMWLNKVASVLGPKVCVGYRAPQGRYRQVSEIISNYLCKHAISTTALNSPSNLLLWTPKYTRVWYNLESTPKRAHIRLPPHSKLCVSSMPKYVKYMFLVAFSVKLMLIDNENLTLNT